MAVNATSKAGLAGPAFDGSLTRGRDAGIDLLRALTMFVMIFVNDFWKIHDVPHSLEHAAPGEDFMGLADVVFPCFLFVVGMSIPHAIERRRARGVPDFSTFGHILSRTFALLMMGVFIVNSEARLSPDAPYSIGVYWIAMVAGFVLVWNSYPRTDDRVRRDLYTGLRVMGVLLLAGLALGFRDPGGGVFSARWWGILGTIGWSYLVCAVIYLFTRGSLRWLGPLSGAFVAICMLSTPLREVWGGRPVLDLPRPNFWDDFTGGVLHIGGGAEVALVMGGVVFSLLCSKFGHLPARRKALGAVAIVALLGAAGFAAHRLWIVSKPGGTPPWVLWVMAIAVGMYALLSWLDSRGWAGWMKAIAPAGSATLTCYLVPYLAYALADMTGIVLPGWATHGVAGLVNCLCFAFAVIGATWALGKMNVKLKI